MIADRMGWSAAALSEAGRSREQIATQLKILYERLFEPFNPSDLDVQALQTANHQDDLGLPGISGSSNQVSARQAILTTKMENMSVNQMHASGYPESLINNAEHNIPVLQDPPYQTETERMLMGQQQLRLQPKEWPKRFPEDDGSEPIEATLPSGSTIEEIPSKRFKADGGGLPSLKHRKTPSLASTTNGAGASAIDYYSPTLAKRTRRRGMFGVLKNEAEDADITRCVCESLGT